MLIDELKIRKAYLEKVLSITEKNLSHRVSGMIRADKRNGVVRYYFRESSGSGNGTYLPADKIDVARRIVQQGYDERVQKLAEAELKIVNKLLKLESPDAFVREFEKLDEYRKPLVKPYKISDEEYAEKWQAKGYEGRKPKPDEAVHFSMKGELMHSKAEVNVADTCASLGIPYRYEYPHKIRCEGTNQTWYPDFTALNTKNREEFIIEYFGLMGNDEYRINALKKIEIYEANGYYIGKNLIVFFEGGDCRINEKRIRETLKTYLK